MRNFLSTICLTIIIFGCQSNQRQYSESNNPSVSNQSDTLENQAKITPAVSTILKHRIVEKQDISYANTPRMVYRIILEVDSLPSEAEMIYTAKHLWKSGNQNLMEFTVFEYLPTMNIHYAAFGVAEFNTNGMVSFQKNESALYDTKWEVKEKPKVVPKIPENDKKNYEITVSATNEVGRIVKVKIESNFPDGTILTLHINRIHYLRGKNEAYTGDLFEREFTIQNGVYEAAAYIDDKPWYYEYQKLTNSMPDDFPPISKISDSIEISVLYTSAADQPANVTKILGAKGEYIKGEGVEKHTGGTIGLLTTLSASMKLKLPFKK